MGPSSEADVPSQGRLSGADPGPLRSPCGHGSLGGGLLAGSDRSSSAPAVGLAHRASHVPPKVSGGERQRAAFARALVNKPEIILGDEPTGNVDTKTGEMLLNLLLKIKEENNTTIIIVTHNLDIAKPADHQIFIQDGKIKEEKFK